MQWLFYVLLRVHFFLFSKLYSSSLGNGELQPADTLDCEVSGTHFEEYYVITVLWDVT